MRTTEGLEDLYTMVNGLKSAFCNYDYEAV